MLIWTCHKPKIMITKSCNNYYITYKTHHEIVSQATKKKKNQTFTSMLVTVRAWQYGSSLEPSAN